MPRPNLASLVNFPTRDDQAQFDIDALALFDQIAARNTDLNDLADWYDVDDPQAPVQTGTTSYSYGHGRWVRFPSISVQVCLLRLDIFDRALQDYIFSRPSSPLAWPAAFAEVPRCALSVDYNSEDMGVLSGGAYGGATATTITPTIMLTDSKAFYNQPAMLNIAAIGAYA